MNRAWIFAGVLVAFAAMNGCDSENNIDLPSDSYFLKFFGGDGDQEGVDLVVAPDGTILMFGTSELPNGLTQWYLVNADANGNLLWERTYGDPNKNDEARDIELTDDGRIVLAGNEENSPGERDVFVMTLTLAGVAIDSARVNQLIDVAGNGENNDEDVRSISQIGNEFMVVGSTTSIGIKLAPIAGQPGAGDIRDALFIRFDNALQVVDPDFFGGSWRTTGGYYYDDVAVKAFPSVNSGKYYVFGYTNNEFVLAARAYNFWIVELGLDGEIGSNNLYTQPINQNDPDPNQRNNRILSSAIASTPANGSGFAMFGISRVGSTVDIFAAKADDQISFVQGELNEKTLNSIGDVVDVNVKAANATASGGFFVVSNFVGISSQNMILTKASPDLALLWTVPVQFGGSQDDSVGAVAELSNGRIVIVGTMRTGDDGERKMVLMKLNQRGRFAK